jgi:hypothetical protein
MARSLVELKPIFSTFRGGQSAGLQAIPPRRGITNFQFAAWLYHFGAGIAHHVCKFERPDKGLVYCVLLVPVSGPQIGKQCVHPAIKPFVKIQDSGSIEAARRDCGVGNCPTDGKTFQSGSHNGRSRHAWGQPLKKLLDRQIA